MFDLTTRSNKVWIAKFEVLFYETMDECEYIRLSFRCCIVVVVSLFVFDLQDLVFC